jgi:hypothetical protein
VKLNFGDIKFMKNEEPIKTAKDLVGLYVKNKDDMNPCDRKLAEDVIKAAGVDPLAIGGETMEIKAMERKFSAWLVIERIKFWLGRRK